MKIMLALATAVASMSAAALAADLPARSNAPAAVASSAFNWTGFYAGATLGGVFDDAKFTKDSGPDWYSVTNATVVNMPTRGLTGGVEVGYNHQFGQLVVGGVADYSLTSAKGSTEAPALYDAPYGVHASSTVRSFGSLRGLGGIAFDRALVYATGGLAFGQVSGMLSDYDYAVYDKSAMRAGWTAGAGVSYAVSNTLSIKSEALYYDLGKKSVPFVYSSTNYGPYSNRNTGLVARLGVDYKFQ
jgi:outer membrane immunogenic protein